MENEKNENIITDETAENTVEYYEFPEEYKPFLNDCHKMYEIIKSQLLEVDKEWLTVKGRHSLIVDFKLDLIYLMSFLSVMSGGIDEYPLYVAAEIFADDPFNNDKLSFIRAADNIGIRHLIKEYKVTPEDTVKFDEFTKNTTNILKILPSFGDFHELSIIYYLYGSLIAGICKLLERNARSSIIITGINNYLNTQFNALSAHLSPKDFEEFKGNVFPYLQHINDRMHEIDESIRKDLGIEENENK